MVALKYMVDKLSLNTGNSVGIEYAQFDELCVIIGSSIYSSFTILVDSNTKGFCLPKVDAIFQAENKEYNVIEVPARESSKSLEVCSVIWNKLTDKNVDRNGLLINLGGGVVTDLGAFAAATYKRGISFINLPTTLLGIIDASIGGKCGIDFQGYKNQIGVFKAADYTLVNPLFLETLPEIELKSGMAEVIKHALIADADYFRWIKNQKDFTSKGLEQLISVSIGIKQSIVEVDPEEKGVRKKLNFGHTIGHAIESFYFKKRETIPHGFAIAAGMICETHLSGIYCEITKNECDDVINYLGSIYKKLDFDGKDFDEIMSYLSQDKKNKGDKNQFALLESIGSSRINVSVDKSDILESLKFYCNR